jgi:hypothetical protein
MTCDDWHPSYYRLTVSSSDQRQDGKIHRAVKGEFGFLRYEMLGELEEAIRSFIDYYNCRRHHEGLGDVTLTPPLSLQRRWE